MLTKLQGPNATTFIVPGECFPTRYRSTSHGMSAAAGKVGAIVAQAVIGPLKGRGAAAGSSASPWLNHVMQIFALFMFLGIFTSLLIPETKRKTLEQLSGDPTGAASFSPSNFQVGINPGHLHKQSNDVGSTIEEFRMETPVDRKT